MSPEARGMPDPLRDLARERGRLLGELGVVPGDVAWARREADALASLLSPRLRLRLPAPIGRVVRPQAPARRQGEDRTGSRGIGPRFVRGARRRSVQRRTRFRPSSLAV